MAKKEIAKEVIIEKAIAVEQEVVLSQAEPTGKQKIRQKIDDALNGKTIIDNNDLREVLQYL